ncbi:MAG: hypothetical protein KJP00_10430, partial [Bacteroidia bacterium]|nr:hypothetical protein [Bacteroidia bacterium]
SNATWEWVCLIFLKSIQSGRSPTKAYLITTPRKPARIKNTIALLNQSLHWTARSLSTDIERFSSKSL